MLGSQIYSIWIKMINYDFIKFPLVLPWDGDDIFFVLPYGPQGVFPDMGVSIKSDLSGFRERIEGGEWNKETITDTADVDNHEPIFHLIEEFVLPSIHGE